MSKKTDNELLREYRQAKNKTKQIKIMQELYSLTKEEVLRKLRNAGIEEKELPKALRITTIEKAMEAAEDKRKAQEMMEADKKKPKADNKQRQQATKEPIHKKIPQAVVEIIEKEMFFLKENINRDNARLKELADFLGREAL